MRDHLLAQLDVAFGLGGLALQRIHLTGDFFQNVEDAGKVLFRAFQFGLGEAALRLETRDPGGFFDDGAAVLRA